MAKTAVCFDVGCKRGSWGDYKDKDGQGNMFKIYTALNAIRKTVDQGYLDVVEVLEKD